MDMASKYLKEPFLYNYPDQLKKKLLLFFIFW